MNANWTYELEGLRSKVIKPKIDNWKLPKMHKYSAVNSTKLSKILKLIMKFELLLKCILMD